MNGKIQGIIVCGVIIACLGGTLAFLELTGSDSTEDSTADSSSVSSSDDSVDETVLVIDSSSDKISAISVSNEYGEFTMVKPASGKTTWAIEELSGLNVSSTLMSGMAENVAQMEAYKTVEEDVEDMSKYGLAEPSGEFTVTFSDGTERSFCVGDVSTKSRYRYFCEKGESTVYMMLNSKVSYFIEPVENFISTTLIEDPDDDDMPDYGTLTVSRQDLDYDMVFVQDENEDESLISAQVMTEPIFAYLNITGSSDTTHGLYGLTADSVAKIFPDESDFEEYGLTEPFAEVTFVGDGYDYDLKIGNAIYSQDSDGEDTTVIGSYYCYLTGVDGIDCIWEISADNLPWATVVPGDVISLMTTNNIMKVDEVKVTNDGEVSDYVLDSDGDSTINSVKKNGEDVDVSLFQDLYKFLISCPTNEIYFDEVTGDPYLTIDIICSDGHTDTMEFYKDSSRRDVIVLNGRPSYKIQSTWTERFISNMGNLDEGIDMVETY